MDHEQLTQLTATELANLIASKQLSPVEVMEAYLERIECFDPLLNAYITVCRETALREAYRAEEAIMRGDEIGPLHGLPFAVKDQFETAGIRTTAGSTILADYIPSRDATAVTRARRAGAILLGKLNMTEFAAGLGDPFKYGEPKNPWDLTRGVGGSSSGSAVAIAASLCAISLGEDTGGSMRQPAALAGIVGVRPTWSLVSRCGMLPLCWSMDAAGPMTRTVEDAALFLRAIAGHDPADPQTSRRPVPDYIKELNRSIAGVRVGMVAELMDERFVAGEILQRVQEAAAQLEQLGAIVEEVSLPLLAEVGPAMGIISGSHGAFVHRKWLRERPEDFGPILRRRWLAAALYPAQVYHKATQIRASFRQAWLALFQEYDVLISPTTRGVAGKIHYRSFANTRQEAERASTWFRCPTMAASLAGTPAMTVPCGFNKDNLPIGLQIMTDRFREDLMFNVGYAFAQSVPWPTRRPSLATSEF